MINLTLNEAKVALLIVEDDIDTSGYCEQDYTDITAMQYLFDRAVLFHRLKRGIDKEISKEAVK